jgi:PPOX class probable F420-dependent enzyme
MSVPIVPADYRDLTDHPIVISLATVNPDGQPQLTPVWYHYDGEFFYVNSALGRQKVRNMQERPQVTILAMDPNNPYRWMEARGDVVEHYEDVSMINLLSKKYRGQEDYYAGNEAMRGAETRITFKIQPDKIIARG